MATLREMIRQAVSDGFQDENAEAKVCQDVVLKALSESKLCRNATVKGGVVMRSITGDARRATQDLDIDFIRYSINDDSIRVFIHELDCLQDIHIQQIGVITELKQQNYHGKRVFIRIFDDTGDSIESKIDLGVHKNLQIEQEEYCFDIAGYDDGASLLINSKEQMFTEKLRSLLKFGQYSTRYGKMRFLRKMQESMPYGRRCDGQLEKKKEWNRVYSMHGMCEKLPKECTLNLNLCGC